MATQTNRLPSNGHSHAGEHQQEAAAASQVRSVVLLLDHEIASLAAAAICQIAAPTLELVWHQPGRTDRVAATVRYGDAEIDAAWPASISGSEPADAAWDRYGYQAVMSVLAKTQDLCDLEVIAQIWETLRPFIRSLVGSQLIGLATQPVASNDECGKTVLDFRRMLGRAIAAEAARLDLRAQVEQGATPCGKSGTWSHFKCDSEEQSRVCLQLFAGEPYVFELQKFVNGTCHYRLLPASPCDSFENRFYSKKEKAAVLGGL